MMHKLPISVLIPTMNRPETLDGTLSSFFKGSGIPSQIVVVDQSDKERAALNEAVLNKFRDIATIKYVYQETPSSTKARNNAYQYATEEIIIYSDDDVLAYPETFNHIFDIMQRKNVAMIAGIDDNTRESETNIGYLLGTKSFKNRKIGHVTLSVLGRYPDNITGEVETQWAMGYFFAVRKSLLDKWQIKWDENLISYAYAEDLDFSYSYYKRAKSENLKCILNENVHVKHCVSQEYRTPSKKSTYMYVINRYYISHKHNMGKLSVFAMDWCNFWRLIEAFLKKGNYRAYISAMKYARKHSGEIKEGIFRY